MKPVRIAGIVILVVLAIVALVSPVASADEHEWRINYQYVTLDLNGSSDVGITYVVDAEIVKGVWWEVWLPMTASDMQVYNVTDVRGTKRNFRLSPSEGQIQVWDFYLRPGDHVHLTVTGQLPHFVYKANVPGYKIVSFIPPWWDLYINDTKVEYVLPTVINNSEVFTGTRHYTGIGTQSGRTVVYFENTSLRPNQQFDTAVSIPERYYTADSANIKPTPYDIPPGVDPYIWQNMPDKYKVFWESKSDEEKIAAYEQASPETSGSDGSYLFNKICNWLPYILSIVLSILKLATRIKYHSPEVSMDGVNVNKDLDPVEAAMLRRTDPGRIFTMIMFGLMKKGNIKLISANPVELEPVSRKDLTYYEKHFMDAIEASRINEDRLLICFRILAQRVVDKTRPYCRKDTEEYYEQKVKNAWEDIEAVDTPELKLMKYDSQLLWLMADEDFAEKSQKSLKSPGWDTTYIHHYSHWYDYQDDGPRMGSTGSSVPDQITMSVEGFAKSISDSVESFSSDVIRSTESFLGIRNEVNAPTPAMTAPNAGSDAGSGGIGIPHLSCACVSCACACAHCACACACAGGGRGCT